MWYVKMIIFIFLSGFSYSFKKQQKICYIWCKNSILYLKLIYLKFICDYLSYWTLSSVTCLRSSPGRNSCPRDTLRTILQRGIVRDPGWGSGKKECGLSNTHCITDLALPSCDKGLVFYITSSQQRVEEGKVTVIWTKAVLQRRRHVLFVIKQVHRIEKGR